MPAKSIEPTQTGHKFDDKAVLVLVIRHDTSPGRSKGKARHTRRAEYENLSTSRLTPRTQSKRTTLGKMPVVHAPVGGRIEQNARREDDGEVGQRHATRRRVRRLRGLGDQRQQVQQHAPPELGRQLSHQRCVRGVGRRVAELGRVDARRVERRREDGRVAHNLLEQRGGRVRVGVAQAVVRVGHLCLKWGGW